MSLSCSCDFDGPDIFNLIEVSKSRKEHTCYECRKLIPIGSLYYKHVGLWDGSWDEYKLCEPCQDLMESLAALGFCTGYGDLHSDYREYLEEYKPPKLSIKQ